METDCAVKWPSVANRCGCFANVCLICFCCWVGLQRMNPEMASHPIYLTSFGNLSWQQKKHWPPMLNPLCFKTFGFHIPQNQNFDTFPRQLWDCRDFPMPSNAIQSCRKSLSQPVWKHFEILQCLIHMFGNTTQIPWKFHQRWLDDIHVFQHLSQKNRHSPGNLPGLRCLEQSAQRFLHHCCRLRQRARRLSAGQREVGAHHPGQGAPVFAIEIVDLPWFSR